MSLTINDSKSFYTNNERENDATTFDVVTNKGPYKPTAEAWSAIQ